MAGTLDGGNTLRRTMIKKYGSDEAWRAEMRRIAAKGGKATFKGKGFAGMTKAQVSAAGKKGGASSTRLGVKQPASFYERNK